MTDTTQAAYVAAYRERNAEEPSAWHCAAMWPATGHQCELVPGHAGHHDRIISGTWVRWCDAPASCTEPRCDLRPR